MPLHVSLAALGFPVWLRTTHWINVLFLGFLIRSGIQILGALPKLYWRDDAMPGTEWLKFTKQEVPQERLWVSQEEQVAVSPWLGQPGGNNLGLGRYWHFFAVLFWILNGVVYLTLLFATDQWPRLLPTSWSLFPQAWQTLLAYLTLHPPPAEAFHPYNPLQQLTYSAVVFLLSPFLIVTGAAQSAAFEARFPWYTRLFGGRQAARSLHFLGLVAFVLFTALHTALVVIMGLPRTLGDIMLGQHQSHQGWAIALGLGTIAAILLLYGVTSWYSGRFPRRVQHGLRLLVNPMRRAFFPPVASRQQYGHTAISPFFRAAGYLPQNEHYQQLAQNHFRDWHLEVKGLVEQPLCLSLADLQSMPKQTQITRLHCIQGWSDIAEWTGVPMAHILARCRPLPTARFFIFHSYQEEKGGDRFYEAIAEDQVKHPQTILAYEMNGKPLPIEHGAPLRLRVETQLGFKMVKWLRAIEAVEDFRQYGQGQGGSREDLKFYDWSPGL